MKLEQNMNQFPNTSNLHTFEAIIKVYLRITVTVTEPI